MLKKVFFISIVFVFQVSVFVYSENQFVVMTYNIRYNNPEDGINSWQNRKIKLINVVKSNNPDVLCVQEALFDQVKDIDSLLNKEYQWFGAGRDDGKRKGEFSAIFFKKELFNIVSGSNFWLSEKPEIPGKLGWDAACTRIVTYVELTFKINQQKIFIFNTHFDHIGELARRESAILLKNKVKEICNRNPVVITGDFNCSFNSVAYSIIVKSDNEFKINDSFDSVKQSYTLIPPTYTGFKVGEIEGEHIDFVFTSGNFIISNYKIDNTSSNSYYPSDHLPVIVNLKLQ